MRPRRLRATFATALLVASLPGAALAAPPTRNSGPLVDLQSATANPTDGASARVQAVAHGAGTSVSLHVEGLTAPAGTTLGAHVHTGPCVADAGGAAGPHFNIDVSTGTLPAEVSDRTEVWLDITTTDDGVGHAVAQVPFHIPVGEAQSVVIHALPTDHSGAAGARLACLGIDLVTTATASAGIQTAARLRLGATLQDAGASALAGGLAGVLALGVGSRVAMRLVALTSGRIGTGIRPDSGAVPGTFTLEGTMFLLVAGAMFGAVLGLALTFLAARWLPVRPATRTLVVTAIGGGLVGLALLDPDNIDFTLFGPTWLAVALFAACCLGYGLLLARLWERWRIPRSRAGRVALPVVGALGLALPLFPILLGVPVVGLAVLGLLVLERGTEPDGRGGWWHASAITAGGRILLAAVAAAGGASLVLSVVSILTAAARSG